MASPSLNYDPSRHFEVETEDVEYRRDGDQSWLALIYQPQGPGPFPLILDIHGGAWSSGDRTNNPAIAEGLAESGVVVASIDFRYGGEHPYPSSLQDINYATRWLKAHAADFNADPTTVGGLGVSSGGHLVMLSAMRPNDPRYTALPLPGAERIDASLAYVITCWGVLDPYGRYLMAKSDGRDNLVENHDRYFLNEETQQEASPLMILQRGEQVELPPALLVQGTADVGVPRGMVEDVASLYKKAGGDAELALFEGMPHGIAGWPEPNVSSMIARVKSFLQQRLATLVRAS